MQEYWSARKRSLQAFVRANSKATNLTENRTKAPLARGAGLHSVVLRLSCSVVVGDRTIDGVPQKRREVRA